MLRICQNHHRGHYHCVTDHTFTLQRAHTPGRRICPLVTVVLVRPEFCIKAEADTFDRRAWCCLPVLYTTIPTSVPSLGIVSSCGVI